MHNLSSLKLAVIGMGYVGLPLAVEFGKKRNTVGFDINNNRIKSLSRRFDETLEVSSLDIENAKYLEFSSNIKDLSTCNIYVVCVPTPIDDDKNPNLIPLMNVTKLISSILNPGDIIVYESTVYPGVVEDECGKLISDLTGFELNKDFYLGYSPERINPGDKKNTLTNIVKVTSGSNNEVLELIDSLYKTIIKAGTYKATSIKVAEAAKVIENIQRDVNIALINELSMIFNKLNIDTEDVLTAAETKWNFIKHRPGLVGGHCIGVDPYYLAHKSKLIGHEPRIINTGREINDGMSNYVYDQIISLMQERDIKINESKVLILGYSFKENCPDIRNTKVHDIVKYLAFSECSVDIYDPWVDQASKDQMSDINFIKSPKENYYDVVIIAVGHKEFIDLSPNEIRGYCNSEIDSIIYDLKYVLPKNMSDLRL